MNYTPERQAQAVELLRESGLLNPVTEQDIINLSYYTLAILAANDDGAFTDEDVRAAAADPRAVLIATSVIRQARTEAR